MREEVDPKGRKVDLFPKVDLVNNFIFNHATDNYISDYLPKIIDRLMDIRGSGNKRVRERSFPVWIGRTTNRLDMDMVCISLPHPILSRVDHYFWEAYYKDENYLETGLYKLRDVQGVPICRYDYGKIILYILPFENPDWLKKMRQYYPSEDFELRSWQKVEKEKKDNPYSTPPKPNFKADQYHDLKSWNENRANIIEYLRTLTAPMGYAKLKRIAQDYFGISVVNESLPGFYKYGCLRLSWLLEKDKVGVRILINKHLHHKLKYIVLAHEICHYVLHFPLLLLGQMVEEGSWKIPELEWYFRRRSDHFFGKNNYQLELDANQLASFFLIPAWMFPMKNITSIILEGGRKPSPTEMIWRFLQPLFPDTDDKEYSWVNWNEMIVTVDNEMHSFNNTKGGANSLYMSILNATVLREVQMVREDVSKLIEDFHKDFYHYYRIAINIVNGSEDNVDFFKREFEAYGTYHEDILNNWEELSHSGQSFGKKVIPPLNNLEGRQFFKKIPLQPAIYNPNGDFKNDWKYLGLGMNSPAGTIEEWRSNKPEYGLVLYYFESWQINQIKEINRW